MGDIRVEVRVKNARLYRAIMAVAPTVAQFCKISGGSQGLTGKLLGMKEMPFRKDGSLTSEAERICSTTGKMPEELWPKHVQELLVKQSHVSFELDASEIQHIADERNQFEDAQFIGAISDNLNARQMQVVQMRNDGLTYEECGTELGVSRERIRQIEFKALRIMRVAAKNRFGVQSLEDIQ